ncbi:Hypothetical predicted protein [Octopus vulgaris]|uniref:Uncharacterized protein n=1 Tax=Octopus vulgaris TaxID=6645 RepID=A0AA36AR58_OCTVU|nr:Hypothetical predicted protein [Octopus vulgaris]
MSWQDESNPICLHIGVDLKYGISNINSRLDIMKSFIYIGIHKLLFDIHKLCKYGFGVTVGVVNGGGDDDNVHVDEDVVGGNFVSYGE